MTDRREKIVLVSIALKVKSEVLFVVLVNWDVEIGIMKIHCCEPVPLSDES